MEKLNYEVIKHFGPSIFKVKIPEKILQDLNSYIDDILKDKDKSSKLDHGNRLVGDVTQEFKLENEFIDSSGFHNFLGKSVKNWIKISENQEVTEFKLISSWIVRQFQNEYNPIHWHGGHISGVGYLKVPSSLGSSFQKKEIKNNNGQINLIHGSKQFLSPSSMVVTPEVGDFYFFPHYLMHTVYPFNGTHEERRSISFNAKIDQKIFHVYGN